MFFQVLKVLFNLLGELWEVGVDHDAGLKLVPHAGVGLVFGRLLKREEEGQVRFVDVPFVGWGVVDIGL